MCDRPRAGQESRGRWQGAEDSLGTFSSTCTHPNQCGFIKMRFLAPTSIYPMRLVFDLRKEVGAGAKRE